jgi:hypothetical protein
LKLSPEEFKAIQQNHFKSLGMKWDNKIARPVITITTYLVFAWELAPSSILSPVYTVNTGTFSA